MPSRVPLPHPYSAPRVRPRLPLALPARARRLRSPRAPASYLRARVVPARSRRARAPAARCPAPRAVSQVQWLYCNTTLPMSLLSQYNCFYCDTNFPQLVFLPQYTRLYCDTVSALSSAIQTSVLQYTSSLAFSCMPYNNCIAVQFSAYPMLQYNPAPIYITIQCPLLQYNLGSSPTQICTIFFFRF